MQPPGDRFGKRKVGGSCRVVEDFDPVPGDLQPRGLEEGLFSGETGGETGKRIPASEAELNLPGREDSLPKAFTPLQRAPEPLDFDDIDAHSLDHEQFYSNPPPSSRGGKTLFPRPALCYLFY